MSFPSMSYFPTDLRVSSRTKVTTFEKMRDYHVGNYIWGELHQCTRMIYC